MHKAVLKTVERPFAMRLTESRIIIKYVTGKNQAEQTFISSD